MKIDTDKLEKTIDDLAKMTKGHCCCTATFIGEISGKPIRIAVMLAEEAEEEHDYEGIESINPDYVCIDA